MRISRLLFLGAALLLAACSSQRKLSRTAYHDPRPVVPTGSVSPSPSSRAAAQLPVRRGVLGWLPGRRPAAPDSTPAHRPIAAYAVPRKCKGCTFNVVAGDQQVVGKKATAAAAGATALGSTHGQTVTGDGNTSTAPVAAAASGGLLGKIKRTLGDVAGYVLLFGLLLLGLLFLFRKRFGIPF